jgi:type I restriction enzyme S subunit
MATSKFPLKSIMPQRTGSVNPMDFPEELFDLYSIPAYDKSSPDIVSGCQIGSTKQVVQEGDVLLSKIVPHVRRCWIVGAPTGRRQIASGEWIIFRSAAIHNEYLRRLLLSDTFHTKFMSTVSGVGGSLLRARPSVVANFEILLPLLETQKRVAAILDTADAIRKKRQETHKLIKDLSRSAFLEMFGDPVANLRRWEVKELRHLTTKIGSGATPLGGELVYRQSGIALIRSLNVHDGQFQMKDLAYLDETQAARLSNVKVLAGDLLLNITGASVARACLVPEGILPARVNQHVCIVRSNGELVPEFLEAQILCDSVKARLLGIGESMGATRQAITKAQLESFKLIVPPMEKQKIFAQIVHQIAQQKRRMVSFEVDASSLYGSLQQQYFGLETQ